VLFTVLLDVCCIHFDGCRTANKIQGKDNSTRVLIPNKNSLHPLERTPLDPDTCPIAQFRVWLDVQSAPNTVSETSNLGLWKGTRFPTETNEVNNARSLQNAPSFVQGKAHENVAWEKWQLQAHATIFPAAQGAVEGQEMFETTHLELGGHGLFMIRTTV
jgi:hypothetical protein